MPGMSWGCRARKGVREKISETFYLPVQTSRLCLPICKEENNKAARDDMKAGV